MKCTRGHEIQVLHSGAGYYIGTVSPEDGSPYCRLSQEYYPTAQKAETALNSGMFTMRSSAMETIFCNGGKGCIQQINN